MDEPRNGADDRRVRLGDTQLVSVIMPVHNAEAWLSDALSSVVSQTYQGMLELSIFNDACTDGSMAVVESWRERFTDAGVQLTIGSHDGEHPRGVGFAKNQAILQCNGDYLCFLDADDVMAPSRIEEQLAVAKCYRGDIIGCCFHRSPAESTARYTRWACGLSPSQLLTQVFTAYGPTVIQPTWFCHHSVFARAGPFDEGGKGVPEDLIFFFRHLDLGGGVRRVDADLLMYRYHRTAASFSVTSEAIWDLRVAALQRHVLSHWPTFTIWNAGKQGRKLYRSLSPENRTKVSVFCDVDVKKVNKGFYRYEEGDTHPRPTVPIVHFSNAQPPFVLCVKLDLTGGDFEDNLASLNLTEGIDYVHFS